MFAADRASRGLGMRLLAIGAGSARLQMTVRDDMLNGHEICHGGFITTLADSAFAFACNSNNQVTVASGLSVEFLAPARPGDVLTADATEVSRGGRTGVYDMVVTNRRRPHRPRARRSVALRAGPSSLSTAARHRFEGDPMTVKRPVPGELEP